LGPVSGLEKVKDREAVSSLIPEQARKTAAEKIQDIFAERNGH
jgi:hypothetical protein